jgi:type II secretory pathway pseudopilin PulG
VKVGKIAAALIVITLAAAVAINVIAETPDEAETQALQQDLRDADAVCKKHRAELMKIPHVKVVTTEIDPRKDAVILVEVDDPENIDEVTRNLPPRIEGYPVEVEDSEPPLNQSSGDARYWARVAPNQTRFPTIDENGNHHHVWLTPAIPAATPRRVAVIQLDCKSNDSL